MTAKTIRFIAGALLPLALLIPISCKGTAMSPVEPAAQPPDASVAASVWEALSRTKVYFGHQSVGHDILDGVRALMKDASGARLDIRETADPAAFAQPVFAHSPIGKNTAPLTKIEHFRRVLESGVGDAADIAFFKLCYVDIHGGTDVEALIRAYDEAMAALRARFPKLTIAVVTAPLTAIPSGLKESVKKLLGRGEPDKAANAKREAFNAHLRGKYGPLVFDLAGLESTAPDGARTAFDADGRAIPALYPGYTMDGGHLNAEGSRIAAAGLLRFLAGLGRPARP